MLFAGDAGLLAAGGAVAEGLELQGTRLFHVLGLLNGIWAFAECLGTCNFPSPSRIARHLYNSRTS